LAGRGAVMLAGSALALLVLALACILYTPSPTHDLLTKRAAKARTLALQRLLEIKTDQHTWEDNLDISAFYSAVYIIMLRTTGQIEHPGAYSEELAQLRHMISHRNTDGGFYKFRGSPSNKAISRLAVTALKMGLGEFHSEHFPERWFRPNPLIDAELTATLHQVVKDSDRFIKKGKKYGYRPFELDHLLISHLMIGYIDKNRCLRPLSFLEPELGAAIKRYKWLSRIESKFNPMTRKVFPALAILYRRVCENNVLSSHFLGLLQKIPCFRRSEERSIKLLAEVIRAEQNVNGGWFYNALFTMINVMALCEAGVMTDDPSIQNALAYLRTNTFSTADRGAFIDFMNTDMWDTAAAVYAYLRIPGHSAMDARIRPTIEFLLRWQGEDGSFAFGSASMNEPDNDSTAMVMHALCLADKTARGKLQLKLDRAVHRAVTFILSRQNQQGGWSVWEDTFVRGRPGSQGFFKQNLFDVPTPDVTARILLSLVRLGFGVNDEPIRRALEFLLRNQCDNGSWWSRWWSGYIQGTQFVLAPLGELGLKAGPNPYPEDELLTRAHKAVLLGMKFLLECQNPDGGWGETIDADFDQAYAGKGASTPLHTAQAATSLMLTGKAATSPEIERAIGYLLQSMTVDGRWEDQQVTFTVFARTFYYSHPLFNYILPLSTMTEFLARRGYEERAGQ